MPDGGGSWETMLAKALLFLGNTFYTALLLVAAQSSPNKGSSQARQAAQSARYSYNRVQCTLQGEISVVQPSISGKIQQG